MADDVAGRTYKRHITGGKRSWADGTSLMTEMELPLLQENEIVSSETGHKPNPVMSQRI
jgi:hypothetical protein